MKTILLFTEIIFETLFVEQLFTFKFYFYSTVK